MHTPTQPADLPTDWIPSFETQTFTGMDPARFADRSGIPLKRRHSATRGWHSGRRHRPSCPTPASAPAAARVMMQPSPTPITRGLASRGRGRGRDQQR
jgi:hypothetical protein